MYNWMEKEIEKYTVIISYGIYDTVKLSYIISYKMFIHVRSSDHS